MKAERWWALIDKRGKPLQSTLLETPLLFRTKREAINWMAGDRHMEPAPAGTRVARVALTVPADGAK